MAFLAYGERRFEDTLDPFSRVLSTLLDRDKTPLLFSMVIPNRIDPKVSISSPSCSLETFRVSGSRDFSGGDSYMDRVESLDVHPKLLLGRVPREATIGSENCRNHTLG